MPLQIWMRCVISYWYKCVDMHTKCTWYIHIHIQCRWVSFFLIVSLVFFFLVCLLWYFFCFVFGAGRVGLEILSICWKKRVIKKLNNKIGTACWCACGVYTRSINKKPLLNTDKHLESKNTTDTGSYSFCFWMSCFSWCENCISESGSGWTEGVNKATQAYGRELHVIWGHKHWTHVNFN